MDLLVYGLLAISIMASVIVIVRTLKHWKK